MIFVTTGTTMPFDELLAEVDRLALEGDLGHEIICQTGASEYVPKNCDSFAFRLSIDDLLQSSDAVITHGGSTVIKLLKFGRPFVAVANPRGADDHQGEMLNALGEQVGVLWTRDVKDVEALLKQALETPPTEFAPPCFLDDLVAYLRG